MMYPAALRHIAMASVLALLIFVPGMLVSYTAKAGSGPAAAQDHFAIDQFYDELAPFGDWVDHPNHGYVWLPRDVAPDWRPFTVGNWIDTEEYGWYWESHEPFAWAVYHYGRWGFEPDYGWYWVPGDTWAPAWVQWRYSNEYVGWAPEAPAPQGDYAYGGPARYAPPPPQDSWVFVQPRYLTAPAVRSHAVPRNNISIAFSRTTYVYRPEYRDGYVYNYGMPRDRWSRVTRRHVEPRKIYRGHSRNRPAHWNRRHHRDLYVYAPGMKKGARPRKPPKKIAHKPSRAKINAKAAKSRAAQRNRAKGLAPQRPVGPRGVRSPNYRGPGAGGRHPLADVKGHDGRKPPHTKSKAAKSKAAKSKAAKSKAAKSKASKSKAAKSKAQRNRAKGLAPPKAHTRPGVMSPNSRGPQARGHNPAASLKPHGDRKPPQVRRPAPKSKASKSKPSKPKAGNAKAGKSKASKSKAAAKRPAAKPRSAKSKPTKPKSAKPKSAKRKSAKSNSVRAKQKGAPKRRAVQGRGSGKRGGGKKAAACKNKPNQRSCGRRG